ncbi:MAG: EAL domain-containing protein [Chloroflexaceae bacterium]|nr:EAL domain-containing protein [Chloroflexaceae bacterium]
MNNLSTTIQGQPSERRWLIQFLTIFVWSSIAVALFAGAIFVVSFSVAAGLTAAFIAFCAGVLAWARALARHGQIERAGVVLFIMNLVSGVSITLFIPSAMPAVICAPLAAVVITVPYLSRATLRRLLPLAWLSAIVMVLLANYVQLFPPAPWLNGIPLLVGVSSGIGMVLLMLQRYHERLMSLLDSANHANSALRDAQTGLEATVAARTAALQEREKRFRAISEMTSDYVCRLHVVEGDVILDWVTEDPFTRITGYSLAELESYGGWRSMFYHEDRHMLEEGMRVLLRGEIYVAEQRIITRQGEMRWLLHYARPEWDEQGQRITAILVAAQDITSRKQHEQQIERLAYYDPLTGLANRRLLHNRLTTMLHDANQHNGSLAVLYLDLDRFKAVNDTLGHDVGDELLVQVAERLRACVRTSDVLARLGGDEFAVLLPDAHEGQAAMVARRMLEQLDPAFTVRAQTMHVSGSIGVACYPRDGVLMGDLFQHADIAMYRAKLRGGQYQLYHPSMHTYRQEQLQLEAELRQAIDADELTLHFQPILDLHTGTLQRVETLVRWPHRTRGLVPPGQFIPMAEESGLIRPLDRWVVRAALAQAAHWVSSGQPRHVAINLSVHSLQDGDMVEYVALDDFGSGYASLSYLKQLPVDIIKADRSFVQGIGRDQKDEGVLQALLALGKGLGLTMVAEGVEQEEQLAWLRQAGYDQAQGFLLGRPAPAEALAVV